MEPVKIERFYLGCLAHASYAIASEGVAAIIDPQRDIDLYLDAAARNEWKIQYIIETHLHADFVSGHRELAERTGGRRPGGKIDARATGSRFDRSAVRSWADGNALGSVGDHELFPPVGDQSIVRSVPEPARKPGRGVPATGAAVAAT